MYSHIISVDSSGNVIMADVRQAGSELDAGEMEYEQSESNIFYTPDGTEPWGVFGRDNRTWVPKYRYDAETHTILPRPVEDVEYDLSQITVIPTADEDRDAIIVDHEMRLTMLELGV